MNHAFLQRYWRKPRPNSNICERLVLATLISPQGDVSTIHLIDGENISLDDVAGLLGIHRINLADSSELELSVSEFKRLKKLAQRKSRLGVGPAKEYVDQ